MSEKILIIGDLIIDIYTKLHKVSPNQEHPLTSKGYIYRDLGEVKDVKYGGVGLVAKNINVDKVKKYLIGLFNLNYSFYSNSYKVFKELNTNIFSFNIKDIPEKEFLPIKERFLSPEGKIVFRLDKEVKNPKLNKYNYSNIFLDSSYSSLIIVDYDKYMFHKSDYFVDFLEMVLKKNEENLIKYDSYFLQIKPENYWIIERILKHRKETNKPKSPIFIFMNNYEYNEILKTPFSYIIRDEENLNIIVTFGGEKVEILNSNFDKTIIHIPKEFILDKNEINTSGAGDVFFANVINQYFKNKNKSSLQGNILSAHIKTLKYLKEINNISD